MIINLFITLSYGESHHHTSILDAYEKVIAHDLSLPKNMNPEMTKQLHHTTRSISSHLENLMADASKSMSHHTSWRDRLLSPFFSSAQSTPFSAENQLSVMNTMKKSLSSGVSFVQQNIYHLPQFLMIAHQSYSLVMALKKTSLLNSQYLALKKRGLQLHDYEDCLYRLQNRLYEQAETLAYLTAPSMATDVSSLRNLTLSFDALEVDMKSSFVSIEQALLRERASIEDHINHFDVLSKQMSPSFVNLMFHAATIAPPLFKLTAPLNSWSHFVSGVQLLTWVGQYATSQFSEARKSSLSFELSDYNAFLHSLPSHEQSLLSDLSLIRGKLDDLLSISLLESSVASFSSYFSAFFWFSLTLFFCWSFPLFFSLYRSSSFIIIPPPPLSSSTRHTDISTNLSTTINDVVINNTTTSTAPPKKIDDSSTLRQQKKDRISTLYDTFFSIRFFLWSLAFLFLFIFSFILLDHHYAVEVSKLNRAYAASIDDREKLFQLRSQYRSSCKLQNLSLSHRFSMFLFARLKLFIFQNPDRLVSSSSRGDLINHPYCDSLSRSISSLSRSVSSSFSSPSFFRPSSAYSTTRSYAEVFQAFFDVFLSHLFSFVSRCSFDDFLFLLACSSLSLLVSFFLLKLFLFFSFF